MNTYVSLEHCKDERTGEPDGVYRLVVWTDQECNVVKSVLESRCIQTLGLMVRDVADDRVIVVDKRPYGPVEYTISNCHVFDYPRLMEAFREALGTDKLKDLSPSEYEMALFEAGFRRCDMPGHLQVTSPNGVVYHISEAAAEDDCEGIRREMLAYLIDTKEYEDTHCLISMK